MLVHTIPALRRHIMTSAGRTICAADSNPSQTCHNAVIYAKDTVYTISVQQDLPRVTIADEKSGRADGAPCTQFSKDSAVPARRQWLWPPKPFCKVHAANATSAFLETARPHSCQPARGKRPQAATPRQRQMGISGRRAKAPTPNKRSSPNTARKTLAAQNGHTGNPASCKVRTLLTRRTAPTLAHCPHEPAYGMASGHPAGSQRAPAPLPGTRLPCPSERILQGNSVAGNGAIRGAAMHRQATQCPVFLGYCHLI